ncbi:hypothetical protein AAU57_05730 [Nonlabens sp. YIK11]|uniref:RNA polymerase sigma factor n=1 Tax=Nonlabens sp. YIK11 TaxID=1453349 RepID=UPI0006DC54F1|nr:sigma-70 family RNA polymerase sigma factor [Nonlabens sp. YIK11]KQC32869.1 hypothetical protein AAU57_05730 [Nonlabens sp. YIK11]
MNNRAILDLLRSGDPAFFKEQYNLYQREFVGHALKKGVNQETATDIYQDSFIILFENAASGKLTSLTSSLKTYIFGIGNNKIHEVLRKQKKTVNLKEPLDIKGGIEQLDLDEQVLSEKQQLLRDAFDKLGTRCKNIISLFYLEGLTIKEIMKIEHYTSENTVKAQKSRCMKQLKDNIKR